MFPIPRKGCPWPAGLLLVAGCLHPVGEQTDRLVCQIAARPFDVAPPSAAPAAEASAQTGSLLARIGFPSPDNPGAVRGEPQQPKDTGRPQVPTLPPPRLLPRRLQVPPELPGAGVPRVTLPPTTAPRQEREAAIDKLFPPLPPLAPDPQPAPGPDGRPLTLSDLQRLAMSNSPLIRQSASDVEAAKGAVIQAVAYPNPVTGMTGDEVGSGGGQTGEFGILIQQTIPLGGKLTLAGAMAEVDLRNANLALRRARMDVAGQVRAGYFAVLVAQENLKASRALARFTDEVFRVQIDQLKVGRAAAYEPRQLRVLALQARNALVTARNRYTSAWKQLAAALGLPGMPPTDLVGRVDMPIPVYRHDAALARILHDHTDVLTAGNVELKARLNLQKARVTPVPDVTLALHLNKDFPPNGYVRSFTVTFPIPVFDQNRGGIIQAQGNLVRAVEEAHRVRADLTARLAEAFERYDSNRLILEEYRSRMLPDQVEAYLGTYERHQQEPDKVTFGDVVVAQQSLASTVTSYLSTLGALWTAVVDVATLLQTEDLFQAAATEQLHPVPDLEHLTPLPSG